MVNLYVTKVKIYMIMKHHTLQEIVIGRVFANVIIREAPWMTQY